jgi:hypothetical protein
MGIFGRFRRGIVLTKDSISVLRHNPSLLSFPFVGGGAALCFLGVLLGTTYGVVGVPEDEGVALAVLFAVYFVTTFVTSVFTAGLVFETRKAFDGTPVSFRRGLGAAWKVKGKLLVWATVAATIGVVIRIIESSDSRIARVFAWLFSAAWSVMTFFVVPVAVLDPDVGVVGMFKRSGSTFKQTWGETAIGMIGPGLIGFLVFLVGAGLGFGIFTATGSPLAAGGVVALFVVTGLLVAATTRGIIKTSLYVYATEGKRPSEFASRDLQNLNK